MKKADKEMWLVLAVMGILLGIVLADRFFHPPAGLSGMPLAPYERVFIGK